MYSLCFRDRNKCSNINEYANSDNTTYIVVKLRITQSQGRTQDFKRGEGVEITRYFLNTLPLPYTPELTHTHTHTRARAHTCYAVSVDPRP